MTFWAELWRMFRDQELVPTCRITSHHEHCKGCRCNEQPWVPPLDSDGTGNATTPDCLKDIRIY